MTTHLIHLHSGSNSESFYVLASAIRSVTPTPNSSTMGFEEAQLFIERFPYANSMLFLEGMGVSNFPIKETPDEIAALVKLNNSIILNSAIGARLK